MCPAPCWRQRPTLPGRRHITFHCSSCTRLLRCGCSEMHENQLTGSIPKEYAAWKNLEYMWVLTAPPVGAGHAGACNGTHARGTAWHGSSACAADPAQSHDAVLLPRRKVPAGNPKQLVRRELTALPLWPQVHPSEPVGRRPASRVWPCVQQCPGDVRAGSALRSPTLPFRAAWLPVKDATHLLQVACASDLRPFASGASPSALPLPALTTSCVCGCCSNLSDNQLRGPLPESWSRMKSLQKL
jgi:hypothetical protein